LLVAGAYVTYSGDGNPADGLEKIGNGEDVINIAISDGIQKTVDASMERFPDATKATLKVMAKAGEITDETLVFFDDATGNRISKKWKELPERLRSQIKGAVAVGSVMVPAAVAGKAAKVDVPEVDTSSILNHGANNIVNALKLKTELSLKDAGILDNSGRLTDDAIKNSKSIKLKEPISNPTIVKQLTSDGSNINDWGKYRTQSVPGPNGQSIRVHYYKNKVTGEIDYNTNDFKVKAVIPAVPK
jgi:hypothetical protein